jgi:hypothetical protein
MRLALHFGILCFRFLYTWMISYDSLYLGHPGVFIQLYRNKLIVFTVLDN